MSVLNLNVGSPSLCLQVSFQFLLPGTIRGFVLIQTKAVMFSCQLDCHFCHIQKVAETSCSVNFILSLFFRKKDLPVNEVF